ncbi:MAG TPA: hypothetical protein VFG45_00175 [Candidatus Nitrosocosmicus sp.]|nr:hypothetical protein [Candidatus Nitrosocosmicus sp.]
MKIHTLQRLMEVEQWFLYQSYHVTDMIVAVAEPLFQGFEANVEVHPAMNLEDLRSAISKLQQQ